MNTDLSYYYTNLAEIFRKGGFYLFHSLALLSNYSILLKLKKDMSILKNEANKIILASLAINNTSEEYYLPQDLLQKYQYLLPFSQLNVDLKSLLNQLETQNLTEICSDKIKNLYDACVGKKDIYEFSDYIEKGLEDLPEDLKIYEEKIRENGI